LTIQWVFACSHLANSMPDLEDRFSVQFLNGLYAIFSSDCIQSPSI
jgi:hypothetical protein